VDIQAYISSGKLELFVLGELNETEQQEVLAMSKKYPEIESVGYRDGEIHYREFR